MIRGQVLGNCQNFWKIFEENTRRVVIYNDYG